MNITIQFNGIVLGLYVWIKATGNSKKLVHRPKKGKENFFFIKLKLAKGATRAHK